jgi:serine/threonine protein kinase
MIASIITGNAEYDPKVQNLNESPLNLQKEFKVQVSLSDFIGRKDTEPKTLGFFNDILTLLYKANQTSYYIKIIDKKNIINNSFISILNINYSLQIYDYMLNLETHWEDNERLYLVFEGIKRYTTLENLIKRHANDITEDHLLIIFRQILESIRYLHKNHIYGCCLYLSSFIYDKITQTIKLTDIGFSKVFLSSNSLDDNELQNGFTFNEYTPPEVFEKMGTTFKITEIDKLKNEFYDIWQLGILFFKIATFGESPFEDAKNENLRDCIRNKNINYSKLNKYTSLIAQIIDKMLQIMPEYRYNVDALIALIHFKDNKIPLLYFHSNKNEDDAISLSMVNEEKKKIGNDFKFEKELINEENKNEKEINNEEVEIKQQNKDNNNTKNKIKLKGVKIQGNLVNDKMALFNQEIYPTGSVLPTLKKNFINRFNNVDQNLVLELASKLSLLEKEYKKLDENKMAVYNITNYVINNLKKLNDIDNDNNNLLIKKFNNLLLSKRETNELYEEMVKERGEFSQDKFKALISNLIYEIKRLGIELEQEKSTIEKLKKK